MSDQAHARDEKNLLESVRQTISRPSEIWCERFNLFILRSSLRSLRNFLSQNYLYWLYSLFVTSFRHSSGVLAFFLLSFVVMSSHGGRRTGSGRKRIYESSKTRIQVWQKGHQRIWLDYVIYSSWVSAKTKCGYSSDTAFAGHLLSLEQRRR